MLNQALWMHFIQTVCFCSEGSSIHSAVLTISRFAESRYHYETILYASNYFGQLKRTCCNDQFLQKLEENGLSPVVLVKKEDNDNIRWRYNKNVLAIVELCSQESEDKQLLNSIWSKLEGNRQSHTVLVFPEPTDKTYVELILRYCVKNKAMNAVAVTLDSAKNLTYFALRLFPQLKVEVKDFFENSKHIFPDHIGNMHGSPFRVIVGHIIPKSYFYIDAMGRRELSGYFGRLVAEFAHRHNATLVYPILEEGNPISIPTIQKYMEKDFYDTAADMTQNSKAVNISETNFYDFTDWCYMIPVEKPLPSYLFYVLIYDATTTILFFVVYFLVSFFIAVKKALNNDRPLNWLYSFGNMDILNGFLGQPFIMRSPKDGFHRAVCLIICLTGLIFNVTYCSYLNALKASPPKEPRVESLEDMHRAGKRIAIMEEEYLLSKKYITFDSYESLLEIKSTFEEFFALRDFFDTNYIYPVPTTRWTVYQEEQKFSQKPLFRLGNICIKRGLRMFLPLQLNSLFLPSMNDFIGQVQQAGLVEQWKRETFLELLKMKRIHLKDRSEKRNFTPVKLFDFCLIWILLGIAYFIALCCFLLEVMYHKRFEI